MKIRFKGLIKCNILTLILLTTVAVYGQETKPALEGRWDMTVMQGGKELPSWLEVKHSGNHTLVGRFVYASGSARPISEVKFSDGKFNFTIPTQWESEPGNLEFNGMITADGLKGTMLYNDGKTYDWTATRAPSLKRGKAPVWDKPITLFNGKDLSGWHAAGENQWIVEGGILKSPKSGANLISDSKFTDFKLHLEFRYPKGSNSGIYLRGRYEVQISDSKGLDADEGQFAGVYGFLPANEMVAKDPGEWQTFDITLVGRIVTVVANGVTVISKQVIPGITGGALDSKEGEPGPLLIQGDHGPVEFRNITLTPSK